MLILLRIQQKNYFSHLKKLNSLENKGEFLKLTSERDLDENDKSYNENMECNFDLIEVIVKNRF